MSKSDSRKLICTACQHENEIERVYCHNCGEKLDRSLLPALDESKSSEDFQKTRKTVKRMMNPNRFAWARAIKTFVLVEIFAAIVAAGFLASQAPENVPPVKSARMPDVDVKEMWDGMMGTRPGVVVAFKDFDINYYLRKAVKGSEGPLGIKFTRAFVILESGLATVATQRDLWGLPIYNVVTFKPALIGGKWSADVQRIAVGRLTIPAGLAKLVKLDNLVQDAVAKVFEREIKHLDRVEKVEVLQNAISFTTKPAQ